jgi:polysaccharide biosynthesis PFTS motif protein
MDPPLTHFNNYNFVITIFDVTPYLNANSIDFYTFDLCAKFLLETIKAVNDVEKDLGFEILIQVKSKRQRSSNHDSRYFDLLDSLTSRPSIVLLSENVNLYNLIYESDLVVSIPFTSPAFVAKELETPSCYFLGSDDFHLPSLRDGVPVFTSVSSLSEFFRKAFIQNG